ncbi:MAG: CRISPR-associated protein Cas4 [Anaerolineae bacterium]
MLQTILLTLLFFLLLAAFAAWRMSRRMRTEAGIPIRARVVYADTGAWERLEKPLFSRRHLLTGKPDYIVQDGDERIPIEVKPNRVAPEPRLSDTLQLAAYGLLIEETWGTAPPYGLLKYRDAVFRVELTEELMSRLEEILEEMRTDLNAEDVPRSHEEARRCQACGYRAECGQELV